MATDEAELSIREQITRIDRAIAETALKAQNDEIRLLLHRDPDTPMRLARAR